MKKLRKNQENFEEEGAEIGKRNERYTSSLFFTCSLVLFLFCSLARFQE